ncbi:MAG: helix-turn-helix domain-containing protein, partial [Microcystaceae cyanobacterium]
IAVAHQSTAKLSGNYNPRTAEIEMLFERLRQLRKRIADAHSIPPYVIFADSSLKLMAQIQPQTLEAFAEISGVGSHKLQQYGEQFVSEIRVFCQEQKLPTPLPSNSQMITLQFYQQGLSVEEIAKVRDLSISTIYTHLCELIEMQQPVDINTLVLPVRQELIIKAIEIVNDNSLKSLKEYLGESYSYEEIKLVKSWWRRTQKD